jgi:hypothetical protein
MRAKFNRAFEKQRALEFAHRAEARPSMYARDPSELAVALTWLATLAGDEELVPIGPRLYSPSPSRQWAAFAIGWLAEDLLPSDWFARSRAATLGRRVFHDANLTDSEFALVWTLLVMTGLDRETGDEFQDRRVAALQRFGDFCPTPSLRTKGILEGTFVARPFESADARDEGEGVEG